MSSCSLNLSCSQTRELMVLISESSMDATDEWRRTGFTVGEFTSMNSFQLTQNGIYDVTYSKMIMWAVILIEMLLRNSLENPNFIQIIK